MIEAVDEAIDDRHHGVAIGNRKRAPGTEIVLHVDNQQQIIVARLNLHFEPACADCETLAQRKDAASKEMPSRVPA